MNFKTELRCLLLLIVWLRVTTGNDVIGTYGNSVSIECKLPISDSLIWDSADGDVIAIKGYPVVRNSTKYVIEKQRGVRESLVIHNLTLADDKVYRCYDLRRTDVKYLSTVTVLVRPSYINMTSPTAPVDQGSDVTFQCVADGGKPLPDIRWYMIGSEGISTEIIGSIHDVMYSNGTGRRSNTLTFNVTRIHYNSTFICNVTVSVFYEETFSTSLDVQLLPRSPVISGFDGIYDENETVHVACSSSGSKPTASIMWMLNELLVGDFEVVVIPEADGTASVTSYFRRRLSRAMNGSVLTCAVTNSVMTALNIDAVTTNVTLLVSYKPNITIEGNDIITSTSGDQVMLRFHIAALPAPNSVILLRDGRKVNNSSYKLEKRLDSKRYDVILYNVSRSSAGNYSLSATNRLGTTISPAVGLQIHYAPRCAISQIHKEAIHVNRPVHLVCQMLALPSDVTMTWKYRHTRTVINTVRATKENDSSETVFGEVDVDASTLLQYTDTYIECYGTNSVGISTEPCFYQLVHPGPPEAPSNCTIDYQTFAVRFLCEPSFDGGSQQAFSLQTLVTTQYKTVANRTNPEFTLGRITSLGNTTVRMCSVNVEFPDQFSCTPAFEAAVLYGVQSEPITAQPVNTTAFIAGGVVAFLGLLTITAIIIYILRKKQKMEEKRQERIKACGVNGDPRENEAKWNCIFKRKVDLESESASTPSVQRNTFAHDTENTGKDSVEIKVISSTPCYPMQHRINKPQAEDEEFLKKFDPSKNLNMIGIQVDNEGGSDFVFANGTILSPILTHGEEEKNKESKSALELQNRASDSTDRCETTAPRFDELSLENSYKVADIASVLDRNNSTYGSTVLSDISTDSFSLTHWQPETGTITLSVDYSAADIVSVLDKVDVVQAIYDRPRSTELHSNVSADIKQDSQILTDVQKQVISPVISEYGTNPNLMRSHSLPCRLNQTNEDSMVCCRKSSLLQRTDINRRNQGGFPLSKSCTSLCSRNKQLSPNKGVCDNFTVSNDSAICSNVSDNERLTTSDCALNSEGICSHNSIMNIHTDESVSGDNGCVDAVIDINSENLDYTNNIEEKIDAGTVDLILPTVAPNTKRNNGPSESCQSDTDSSHSDIYVSLQIEDATDMMENLNESSVIDYGFASESNSGSENTDSTSIPRRHSMSNLVAYF